MIELIQVNKYMALANDENLTPKAIASGSIFLEEELMSLPEIKNLRSGMTYYDVGAFIGETSIPVAAMGCNVVAFEAQLDAFICLLYNSHDYPNINCINSPVGNGLPVIANNNPLNGNLGTRTVSISADGTRTVSLDDLTLAPPDIIKIDVEGFEPAVLEGATKMIGAIRPTCIVEVYPSMLNRHGYSPESIYRFFRRMEYTVRTAVGEEGSERWDIVAAP